jgi:hypothetical protein
MSRKEGVRGNGPQNRMERSQRSASILTRSQRGSPEASDRGLLERLLPVMREGAESSDVRVPPLAIRVIVHALAEHTANA